MASPTAKPIGKMESTQTKTEAAVTTGPAAAAFISGGIGCLFIGIFTTGAEMSKGLKDFLQWDAAVGPLSGKTGYGTIAFFLSWAILHFVLREKNYDLKKAFTIGAVLTVLGLLLTFPPFFQLFTVK
jgi:hypothetical protein